MKSKNLTRKSRPLTQQKEKHRSSQIGVTGHLVLKKGIQSLKKEYAKAIKYYILQNLIPATLKEYLKPSV